MKWLMIALGGIVVLIALAAVIGMTLPKGHVATHEVRLTQPPDSVWAVITDFAQQPEWSELVESSARIGDINGHPAWRENYGGFTVDMETSEWDPPRRLVRVVHAGNAGFRGSWTWELEPDGAAFDRLAPDYQGMIEDGLLLEEDEPFARLMDRCREVQRKSPQHRPSSTARRRASSAPVAAAAASAINWWRLAKLSSTSCASSSIRTRGSFTPSRSRQLRARRASIPPGFRQSRRLSRCGFFLRFFSASARTL